VPQEVVDSLTSVQVTTAAGRPSGFQLSFAVSKRSLIESTLLPSGYFDPKRRVVIVAVPNGAPTVLIDGVITRQELTPSNDPGGSTLTLTGEDLTLIMDLKEERMCFPGMPAEARVAAICLKYALYGIVPLTIPSILMDVPNPTQKIPIQSASDLQYIRALAAEAGYVFYIDPGPLPGANIAYWGPEVRVGLPQPALSVNMDAASNVETLSFSFDGTARTQYTVDIVEPNTKMTIGVPVPNIGLLRPPLALRPAVALREAPLPDTSALNSIRAALYGLSQTASSADAITGQGTLDVLRYGHVLKARGLVSVRGAGLAYDGLYYCSSVTHNIKRGEYKQSFTLARDGLIPLTPTVNP
jgi:hypothetical protein